MTEDSPHTDRRTFLEGVGAVGVAAAAIPGVSAATPGRTPGAKPNEALVGVTNTVDDAEEHVAQFVPDQARVVHSNETIGYVAVRFPEEAPDRAHEHFLDAIEKREGIKYAERNATHTTSLSPDDPRFGDQYAPQMVNAPAAWETTLGSSSVSVAVVDQGIQYDHPDLAANVSDADSYHGDDFADDDEDPYPDVPQDEYHGTHVGGIAAAATDNGSGVAGVSESSLLSGRALSEDGTGSTSDISDAIVWATDQGADVVNMSLGGGGYTETMKNAVSYAYDNGVLVVCAAGNAGKNSVDYPAAYSECVAVSALDPDGTFASYSNYGDDIELTAPGTNVLSTTTETRGSYERLSGTSMATPVVSGVAGLALARWDLSNAEVRAHLKETAVDVGLSEDEQGSGRVDADGAVSTDPSGDGSGDGTTEHISATVSDSLDGYWDEDCWSWAWQYDDPSKVVVDLSGPSDADFDLYVDEGEGSCPTTDDYDYRGYTADSQETVTITEPDTSTNLHVMVTPFSGSGEYDLTITEYQ
ncbi:S8 family serine peptidase [Halospeciosus flavus]|uniref:S8 family serine peptidase n=1 Tax=Halospeciosus flavus TaxID=3032283 RepID=A0ABD5Z9K4_9EURY|nr:S8 family serine peptidase [Halospeciosus flavus]